MTDDLETAVRAALHGRAEDITPESLRHSRLPSPRGASRTRVLATASVAALAIVAGVGIASDKLGVRPSNRGSNGLAGSAEGHDTSATGAADFQIGPGKLPASNAADPFAGTRWKLLTIDHDGRLSQVPPRLDTNLEFSGGRMGVNDTVNWTSGLYSRTASGFAVSDAATTAEGYIGTDPDVNLVRQAVGALSLTWVSRGSDGVNARVVGDILVITAEGFVLTYVRDGVARTYAPPAPTAPPSPTLTRAPTLSSGDGTGAAAGDPAGADPMDGTRWKLLTVVHDSHVTQVPVNLDTSLEFSDGHASMSDTVNEISGMYVRSATGFTIPQASTTLVGFISQDPERNLVIAAIRAMTPNTPNATADVREQMKEDSLVISVGGYVLTYSRDGQARVQWPPAVTGTPSPTLNSGPALSPGATASPGTS